MSNEPLTNDVHALHQRNASGVTCKWMKKEMVERDAKWGGGTSPSKVYAKRERIADFLRGEGSVESDPKIAEVGLELFGRLEDDPGHPEALSGRRVGGNIVNINGFLGSDLARLERLTIDDRVGLAGADAVGINTRGKEAEEREAGLVMGHMDGIGVRK